MAMKALGLSPGREMGLCTFDDWTIFSLADVTAIRLQTEEVGEMAARMLLERIGAPTRGTARRMELSTQLVVRRSTLR